MKAILLALGLMGVGFAGCAAETGDGSGAGTSGGVVVEALTSSAEGANGIVFVMLPGHVSCPTISSVSASGEAFDVRGASLGAGVSVNLREGLADTGGGSHLLSEDAFFDDVDLGPFTVCAHLLDDAGACMHGCETASAFGNATPAHKAHVTLIMTCNTPPTQDVGAVVEVQNTPIVNLTGAIETGLIGCGSSTSGDTLSLSGKIESPDGTQGEYMITIADHADRVTASVPTGTWLPAGAGFEVTFEPTGGTDPISVPIVISGRTPALDGGYLYAPDYTLTMQWLACE